MGNQEVKSRKVMFGKRFDVSLYRFHYLQFYSLKFTFRQNFYIFTFLNTSVKT